eukprot:TRINITY_DN61438_c0_g1_i1.p2 TRINITY_DN61438_c0_g1~~TRINITY_DN61438_c0_g1_i1.p2  ORF type:complete len:162 (+),score=37.06 TRINITY_DN61438_c0_g1_i1:73-558(+)
MGNSAAGGGSRGGSSSFKAGADLAARKAQAGRMGRKYPDYVCVICEPCQAAASASGRKNVAKFLVPRTMEWAALGKALRRRVALSPAHELRFKAAGRCPAPGELMRRVEAECRDEDGFLYVQYMVVLARGAGAMLEKRDAGPASPRHAAALLPAARPRLYH